MCNTTTLKQGIEYKIITGPSATELGGAIVRGILLEFFLEPQNGSETILFLEITKLEVAERHSPRPSSMKIGGSVCGRGERKFCGVYNPNEHTGVICFL